MPSEEFMWGMLWGCLFATLVCAHVCQKWLTLSHRQSMDTLHAAGDLLAARFDLFRDVHHAAMDKLRDAGSSEGEAG